MSDALAPLHDTAPTLLRDAPAPLHETAPKLLHGAPAVLETTELRWFVPGPLPTSMEHWFAGGTGAREQRSDTYLLSGRIDVGVKRRFRETLELKVRDSVEPRIDLGGGLGGPLEVWRKWSPADGLVVDEHDGPWIDVHKSIVKRRFARDGSEIVFSAGAPAIGSGCDVEIAGVAVGGIDAWTFTFAAFGPSENRRDALTAAWCAVILHAPCPCVAELRTGRMMGYPEWLALTMS